MTARRAQVGVIGTMLLVTSIAFLAAEGDSSFETTIGMDWSDARGGHFGSAEIDLDVIETAPASPVSATVTLDDLDHFGDEPAAPFQGRFTVWAGRPADPLGEGTPLAISGVVPPGQQIRLDLNTEARRRLGRILEGADTLVVAVGWNQDFSNLQSTSSRWTGKLGIRYSF